MKRVIAAIPLSWDYVPSFFFVSFSQMLVYAQGKYELGFVMARKCYMDTMRNNLVDEAMKMEPDYIMFIDADQTYPADTPEILMKHVDDGKLVVGGLTPDRDDGKPMIYYFVDEHGFLNRDKAVGRLSEVSGVSKIDGMGMGGVMVHPSVFEKLGKGPFTMQWDKQTTSRAGEDVQFYLNCKRFGIDVWCDTDLRYGHIVTKPMAVNYGNKP